MDEHDTLGWEVRVPRRIRLTWTDDNPPSPILMDEDTDEPLCATAVAIISKLLDPGRATREKGWEKLGIEMSERHVVPSERQQAYRTGFRDGLAQATEEAKENTPAAQPWWVYLISGLEHHKIGYSTDVNRRLRELKNMGGASSLKLVASAQYADRKVAGSVERHLHNRFKNKRVHGEWFDLNNEDIEEVLRVLAVDQSLNDEFVSESLAEI